MANTTNLPPSLAQGWVLVDFFATWCQPCQMLSPILHDLASDWKGQVTIAKVDVDKSPHVAAAFDVSAMPTMVLCHNGQEVSRQQGFLPKDALQQWVDQAKA